MRDGPRLSQSVPVVQLTVAPGPPYLRHLVSDLVSLGSPSPAPASSPPRTRKVFVHTFGCQMNESDSDRMVELLGRNAFDRADTAEDADLILLNTCAVREKAEQKLLSALGRYREVKARRGALIAVSGCVAQQEKDRLLRRVPRRASASPRPAGWAQRSTSSRRPIRRPRAGAPPPSSPR